MNIIRTLISVLIALLVALSAYGLAWWGHPPEKLAPYATGGRVILAVLIVTGIGGIWRLWAPPAERGGR